MFTLVSRFACLASLLITTIVLPAADDTMSLPTKPAKVTELHFLKAGKPDASELLPPPPMADSAEQATDMASVRSVYQNASEADKQAAYAEKKFSVFNFAPEVGGFFLETNLSRTAAFFEKVQTDAAAVTDLGKDYFKRPRPFTVDTNLANGKLEKSFGYPSGHSTESMVLALVLADLLPDRHDAILAHARRIGWHRVQIARHYPTDIYAGRVLAQAIVKQMKKNDAFVEESAAVKKELEAARLAAKN